MSVFSQLALQTAIYSKLTGDTALMSDVTGVFDRAPQNSEFPYITIGDSTANDWSTKTSTGTEQTVSIHAWSREGGRAQTADLMERVYQLLHQGTLTVSGHTLVLIRLLSTSVNLEGDGVTYHGVLRFRILLEAA